MDSLPSLTFVAVAFATCGDGSTTVSTLTFFVNFDRESERDGDSLELLIPGSLPDKSSLGSDRLVVLVFRGDSGELSWQVTAELGGDVSLIGDASSTSFSTTFGSVFGFSCCLPDELGRSIVRNKRSLWWHSPRNSCHSEHLRWQSEQIFCGISSSLVTWKEGNVKILSLKHKIYNHTGSSTQSMKSFWISDVFSEYPSPV